MPSFKKIMPVLRVTDLQESIDFYVKTLGFELLWRSSNDGGGENCMLQSGETAVMLSTGTHLGGKPAFTGTLYFEMIGVRDFYTQIRDHIEIVWPLSSTEYGTQEFGARDRDGYMLAFAEPAEAESRSSRWNLYLPVFPPAWWQAVFSWQFGESSWAG